MTRFDVFLTRRALPRRVTRAVSALETLETNRSPRWRETFLDAYGFTITAQRQTRRRRASANSYDDDDDDDYVSQPRDVDRVLVDERIRDAPLRCACLLFRAVRRAKCQKQANDPN